MSRLARARKRLEQSLSQLREQREEPPTHTSVVEEPFEVVRAR